MLNFVLSLLTCFVPLGLVIGLIVWMVRSSRKQPAAPTSGQQSREIWLASIDDQLRRWEAEGRLSPAATAEVRGLIAQERSLVPPLPQFTQQPAASAPPPTPARPATTVVLAETPAPALTPATPALTPTPPTTSPTPAIPATPALAPATPAIPTAPATTAIPPAAQKPVGGLAAGALALRTRQLLLYLGAFLLVSSGLILVVFNWRNFPPLLQVGLLAAVCGGMWGAGAWLSRQEGLKQAGLGLQVVGGTLVPVVGFAAARLLELDAQVGWLLASLLSLGVYAAAAWRLDSVIFGVGGGLALGSAALALASLAAVGWQPAALLVAAAALLPVTRWLEQARPTLAAGQRWVARTEAILALLYIWLLAAIGFAESGQLAAALWGGAVFAALAAWYEQRPRWVWGSATLVPLALLATLFATDVPEVWWSAALALLALAYVLAGIWLEPRALPVSKPLLIGAPALAALTLALLPPLGGTRWGLPILIIGGVAATVASHRGRFGWLGANGPSAVGTAGLALVCMLLPVWEMALLDLTTLSHGQQGLALLPLAAVAFAAAAFWPGKLRRPYDWTLQIAAALVSFAALGLVISVAPTRLVGAAAFAALWVAQTLLRRQWVSATVALGALPLLALMELVELAPAEPINPFLATALGFCAVYCIGGTLLRQTTWRYWMWPALGWGILAGVVTVGLALLGAALEDAPLPEHAGAVLAVGAVAALLSVLWQRPLVGFVVAPLVALATMMAATAGFFVGWEPIAPDYGYVLCALAVAGVALGQGLRRTAQGRAAAYALPYEIIGYVLLTLAPGPASDSPSHATIVWLALAMLYGLGSRLYNQPWAVAPALLAADMALLRGAGWVAPDGRSANGGLLLLAATWVQGLLAIWADRRERPAGTPFAIVRSHALPCAAAATLSGLAALTLAADANDTLAAVAGGLAALTALWATLYQLVAATWGSLALLALGFGSLHAFLGLSLAWNAAWGVAESFGLTIVGWAITRIPAPRARIWDTPLWAGTLATALLLTISLPVCVLDEGSIQPLTFAMLSLALLLATLALRQRTPRFAYGAGGALVLATLCQLADWGFTQPQWYALPAGLYLLVLGDGIRRTTGRLPMAQIVETGGAVVLLGTTFGQSLRGEGAEWAIYAAALCVESLLLAGYGTLRKLRVPFLAGVAFFVAGVVWLSLDPLQNANRWVLLGALGLLMVGAYVLLERKQEQLARAGRAFAERLASWG